MKLYCPYLSRRWLPLCFSRRDSRRRRQPPVANPKHRDGANELRGGVRRCIRTKADVPITTERRFYDFNVWAYDLPVDCRT